MAPSSAISPPLYFCLMRFVVIVVFMLLILPGRAQQAALSVLPSSVTVTTSGVGWKKPWDKKVRPFITDDSRVVGHRLAQMESWIRVDKESGQHWALAAYGPTRWLEVTAGGVWGYQVDENSKRQLSYALPLVQAKMLLRPYVPNKPPGVGLVVGSFLPNGKGFFRPPGYGTFAYTTITQSIGKPDQFLLHLNLGGNYQRLPQGDTLIGTWGIGTQFRVYKGWNAVAELFSGDPYIPGTGKAVQVGYRYFFSDLLQVDMTVGQGLAGEVILPFWFSAGVRVVTEKFLHRRKPKETREQQKALATLLVP